MYLEVVVVQAESKERLPLKQLPHLRQREMLVNS
jgi:hypothetical protein